MTLLMWLQPLFTANGTCDFVVSKVSRWRAPAPYAFPQHSCVACTTCLCRYWDFTMSHRWDSHWKKHGRTGPSPFAATPSHRQQWQAQLSKLKQKAAYRRAQQQATHQTEQAGDQRHWSPRQQSEPEEHTHTNQQHSREQQEEQPPERPLEGHQQAVHAERLASQPRHHHRDWLASHGWKEDHLDHHQQLQEMHPAAVGHAPSYQYSQSQAVQQHADFSQMPTPSIKERSTGDSPNVSPQAVQPESNMSSDQSSGMLAVLLTHQLLQQLQQHGHSLEWAVKQNSMMGAAMQHVQSPHSILHKNSHPDGSADVAEDPSVDATADVVTHRVDSHLMPSHSERQANAHEQGSACTPRKSVLASDTGEVAADHQGKTAGPSGGSPSFQTQHSQVQSQLAGLRRRAARKIAA